METTQINLQKEKIDMHQYVEVKSSGIHRHGVFAKKDISKGVIIAEYFGRVISKEESKKIQDECLARYEANPDDHAGTYIFDINETEDWDGDIDDNDAKYINHSCDPNCEVDIINDRILIETIKDIKKGDEITYNYGFELSKDEDIYDFKKNPCRCGSNKCVHYILAEDEWPKMHELLENEFKNNKK